MRAARAITPLRRGRFGLAAALAVLLAAGPAAAQFQPASTPSASAAPTSALLNKLEDPARLEQLARGLLAHRNPLAVDLYIKAINARLPQAGDLYAPTLRPLHLQLAESYLAGGEYWAAEEVLRPLTALEPPLPPLDQARLHELLAEARAGEGRFAEAGKSWQQAIELLAGLKDPAPGGRILGLYLKLADNLLRQGRVPEEAEIELRAALAVWDKKGGLYPEAARINLRLARLLKDIGRTVDSADFYKRAERSARLLLKKEPAEPERALLEDVIAAAARESAPAKKKQKGRETAAEPPETRAEAPFPQPDLTLLELELEAYQALERPGDFEPVMAAARRQAVETYGPDSPICGLLDGLWLKYLDQSNQVIRLADDLAALAAEPRGRDDMERAAARVRLLSLPARLDLKSRLPRALVEDYRQSLTELF